MITLKILLAFIACLVLLWLAMLYMRGKMLDNKIAAMVNQIERSENPNALRDLYYELEESTSIFMSPIANKERQDLLILIRKKCAAMGCKYNFLD